MGPLESAGTSCALWARASLVSPHRGHHAVPHCHHILTLEKHHLSAITVLVSLIVLSCSKAVCYYLQSLGHSSSFCSNSKWLTTLSLCVSETWECMLIEGYFSFVFCCCSYQKYNDVALMLNSVFILLYNLK